MLGGSEHWLVLESRPGYFYTNNITCGFRILSV